MPLLPAVRRPQASGRRERDPHPVWRSLDLAGARSLVFVGGNPTESLPAILEFLQAAPEDLRLSVGWNSSGFDSPQAIWLLAGICDVYLPDFTYGNDVCAEALSNAPGYVANAVAVIEEMCRQRVPVLVRLLVLPGHVECCHLPTLDRLGPARDLITLNVMDQYAPDFVVREDERPLGRRAWRGEVDRVRSAARGAGFGLLRPAGTASRPDEARSHPGLTRSG